MQEKLFLGKKGGGTRSESGLIVLGITSQPGVSRPRVVSRYQNCDAADRHLKS